MTSWYGDDASKIEMTQDVTRFYMVVAQRTMPKSDDLFKLCYKACVRADSSKNSCCEFSINSAKTDSSCLLYTQPSTVTTAYSDPTTTGGASTNWAMGFEKGKFPSYTNPEPMTKVDKPTKEVTANDQMCGSERDMMNFLEKPEDIDYPF